MKSVLSARTIARTQTPTSCAQSRAIRPVMRDRAGFRRRFGLAGAFLAAGLSCPAGVLRPCGPVGPLRPAAPTRLGCLADANNWYSIGVVQR